MGNGKIYQLHFTRLGRQGYDAGWQLTAASPETPQLVQNEFQKIANHLVAIGSGGTMPLEALDIKTEGNYVYLSHVNYHSTNEGSETDTRGVSFVHGMVMRVDSFLDCCGDPAQIAGVDEDGFDRNYTGKKELPVLETLAYRPISEDEALSALHMNDAQYENFMKCIYAALNIVDGSVCLVTGHAMDDQAKQTFHNALYLAYQGLPYILRLKVSAFSGDKKDSLLHLSESADGEEIYYNLETGEFRCPDTSMYEFILPCISRTVRPEEKRQLFETIRQFTSVTYASNYSAVKLAQIELAYQAGRRSVSDDLLDQRMMEAAGTKAYNYACLDSYYAYLIGRYLESKREITSGEVLKKLQKRYIETSDQQLRSAFLTFYAEQMCTSGNVRSYEFLYQLMQTRTEDYDMICDYLGKERLDFLEGYYVDYYLERVLTNYDQVKEFLEANKEGSDKISIKVLRILGSLFKKELNETDDRAQRVAVCDKYLELSSCFPESAKSENEAYADGIFAAYWEDFRMEQFSFKDVEEYERFGLGKDRSTYIPEKVRELIDAKKKIVREADIEDYKKFFLSGDKIPKKDIREKLREEVKEEWLQRGNLQLDELLIMNWSEDKKFNMKNLRRDLNSCNPELLKNQKNVEDAFWGSALLREGSPFADVFKRQLKEVMREKGHAADQWKYVDLYYFPRMDTNELESMKKKCIQKHLMLLAVACGFGICLKYLFGQGMQWGLIGTAIAAVSCLGGYAICLFLGDDRLIDLAENPEGRGILIVSAACTVILIALIMIMAVAINLSWITYVLLGLTVVFLVLIIVLRVLLLQAI